MQKDKEESPARYLTHKGLEHAHEIHKSAGDNTKEASTRSQARPAILLSPLMCALVVNKKGVKKKRRKAQGTASLDKVKEKKGGTLAHREERGSITPPPT